MLLVDFTDRMVAQVVRWDEPSTRVFPTLIESGGIPNGGEQ